MQAQTQSLVALAIVLLLPLLLTFVRGRDRTPTGASPADFLINKGRNTYLVTTAGAISGNVGIGSFIALFLFTNQSPVIGFSIVAAYTLGLLLCALFAPKIRDAANQLGTVGLIDLIIVRHNVRAPALIWLPMAVVFLLRSAVQLGALGLITASLFGGNATVAIALSGVLISLYLLIGGYRAAVETDIAQAAIIMIAALICAFGLDKLDGTPPAAFDFGAYGPAILVGIWLFIPFSALLAIDNWQRITLAASTPVAQRSFITGAIICGALYLLMALAGYRASDNADIFGTFQTLAPDVLPWLPAAMFVACIMSSIDTFIMPLVSSVGQKSSMTQLRLLIITLMAATVLTAILFGDTINNVIAAFNSLAVFLPAAIGALYLKKSNSLAAILSMNAGLLSAIGFTLIDQNSAALVGFVVAILIYVSVTLKAQQRPTD